MPYLPPSPTRPNDPTTFPRPADEDLRTSLALIEEMWEVNYPLIGYQQMDKRTTPVEDVNTLTGEAGSTKWDAMWGEAADPSRDTWKQAQGTAGAVAAADVEVYRPRVELRFMVNHVAAESPDLKKYGFDDDARRVGSLVATVPVSMLDKQGVIAGAGDLLLWEGDEWVVIRPKLTGYWGNTNLRLYMNLLLERRRHGS